MKTCYLSFFLIILCHPLMAQDILVDRQSRISFFSSALLEDITASSSRASSALNIVTNEVAFKVPIKSFEFKRRLMQQHFNENYMESDKYPYATFTGKIINMIDLNQVGRHRVTVTGDLEIHGIKQRYTSQVELEVKGDRITAQTTFNVKLADHQIKIPRVVMRNIAEVVEVNVSATYQSK